ncbi:DUF4232 domain-containing protein [Streptomyces rectiverticillatus]|uniref:DUF4232 domain-containing protein n=1 Tax=Streptomyces rectiverticillatus TaxID=173860 RepID=UPI0015C3233C|nr:DUF4232 domain-containing protein [Streptomyces rectiverticillatus]QLE71815.1 DUF4232 domain-containing protein [Streptomyces rectiverticillatus]
MRASARRAHPHPRPFATAGLAAVALATLSLAACSGSGEGEGVRKEGAASSQPSVPGATALPSESSKSSDSSKSPQAGQASQGKPGAEKGGPTGATPHGAQRTGATRDPYAPENRVPCTAANTKVVAVPLSRPLNHMLLTVTNTGSKMCDLKGYPVVKFEGAQSVPPVMENTKPQAVTSLPPGGEGYASVILSAGDGSGGEGYTARSLEVGFQGSDKMAKAALPAKGVHIDDALRVTYWVSTSEDALS